MSADILAVHKALNKKNTNLVKEMTKTVKDVFGSFDDMEEDERRKVIEGNPTAVKKLINPTKMRLMYVQKKKDKEKKEKEQQVYFLGPNEQYYNAEGNPIGNSSILGTSGLNQSAVGNMTVGQTTAGAPMNVLPAGTSSGSNKSMSKRFGQP